MLLHGSPRSQIDHFCDLNSDHIIDIQVNCQRDQDLFCPNNHVILWRRRHWDHARQISTAVKGHHLRITIPTWTME